jgi:prepilin-type N-terminal cleavage/methylation domain-containing protein
MKNENVKSGLAPFRYLSGFLNLVHLWYRKIFINRNSVGKKSLNGFTLIELLVVISLISLMASVMLVGFNNARIRARDLRRKADFAELNKALEIFFQQYNRMPANNECGGTPYFLCPGIGNVGAISNDGTGAYEMSMQELVVAGLLGSPPQPPPGSSITYSYYNYGLNSYGGDCNTSLPTLVPQGALLVTILENSPATLTGDAPSCRPWHACNWCRDDVASSQYCVCSPQ